MRCCPTARGTHEGRAPDRSHPADFAAALVLAGAVLLFTGRAHYKVYVVESNSTGEATPAGSIILVDTESDVQEGDIVT